MPARVTGLAFTCRGLSNHFHAASCILNTLIISRTHSDYEEISGLRGGHVVVTNYHSVVMQNRGGGIGSALSNNFNAGLQFATSCVLFFAFLASNLIGGVTNSLSPTIFTENFVADFAGGGLVVEMGASEAAFIALTADVVVGGVGNVPGSSHFNTRQAFKSSSGLGCRISGFIGTSGTQIILVI